MAIGLVVSGCHTDEERRSAKAKAILADTTQTEGEAAEKAVNALWGVSATQARVFHSDAGSHAQIAVYLDCPEKPSTEIVNGIRRVTFYTALRPEETVRMVALLIAGEARGVSQVMLIKRYHAVVEGQSLIAITYDELSHDEQRLRATKKLRRSEIDRLGTYDMFIAGAEPQWLSE